MLYVCCIFFKCISICLSSAADRCYDVETTTLHLTITEVSPNARAFICGHHFANVTPFAKVSLSRINSPAFSLLSSTSSLRLCFVTSARLRNAQHTAQPEYRLWCEWRRMYTNSCEQTSLVCFLFTGYSKRFFSVSFSSSASSLLVGNPIVCVRQFRAFSMFVTGERHFLCCYLWNAMKWVASVNESLSLLMLLSNYLFTWPCDRPLYHSGHGYVWNDTCELRGWRNCCWENSIDNN